ncbi:hypothetical protein [Roseivirga pacifica]|uniref:hypothetical protein n=1 Tax=Roseivirga pacifica TaxID=1267423 RepID=UPI00227BB7DC|nr:hypothetical protein [Roseivirga pacifica]
MREFDSTITIFAFSDLRLVDRNTYSIDLNKKTNGLVILYIDGKSADFVHDAYEEEVRAIDHLVDNQQALFPKVKAALSKLGRDTNSLGLHSASVQDKIEDGYALISLNFIDGEGETIKLTLNKDSIVYTKTP